MSAPDGVKQESELFGRYRLEDVIGRGGMGEVWRAVNLANGRTVAVKRLPSELSRDRTVVARFRREAELTAHLETPHVVPIYDFGAIEDRLFIEMRLIPGPTIAALLDEHGALPPARAVELVAQLADALDAAHAAGLVHRDVKPANAIVDLGPAGAPRDFVYLSDFGIVHAMTAGLTSITHGPVGTISYMAPESFVAENRAGPGIDVYALTCVLHECLTGHKPFPQETYEGLVFAHMATPPPAPGESDPSLAAFDPVIAGGMAKDPYARPPTAGTIAVAARRALEGVASAELWCRAPAAGGAPEAEGRTVSLAALPTRWSRTGPLMVVPEPAATARRATARSRGRSLVLGSAALAVALALAVTLFVVLAAPRAGSAAALATVPVAAGPVAAGSELRSLLTVDLGGTPQIVAGSRDNTIRVWNGLTHEPIGRSMLGHSGSVNALVAARLNDTAVVVSAGDDMTVRVWDLATHAPVGTPMTGHTAAVTALAVDVLDGAPVIVSGAADRTVRVWSLATHAPLGGPLTGHSDGVTAVGTTRIGGQAVIVSGSLDRTVRVWNLVTRESVGAPIEQPPEGRTTVPGVLAMSVTELDGAPVVATGNLDGTARVWNLETHQAVAGPLAAHGGSVRALATPQLTGRPVLVTGGFDHSVRLWDLATLKPVGPAISGHSAPIRAVVAVPVSDGLNVATAGDDATIRISSVAAS